MNAELVHETFWKHSQLGFHGVSRFDRLRFQHRFYDSAGMHFFEGLAPIGEG
jgi:hypothetical protein